ncbi:MAG: hypothetical protein JOZ32_05820 [Bryobacterales bacterium]|nr:hypothetical protein [Bryobacterales bacterium]
MMRRNAILIGAALLLPIGTCLAQPQQVRVEPVHDSGQSVSGAFEGWFRNPDGTFSILLGYFNRNAVQELDIPIGPRNSIEPGGPDQGQPTHFLPRRQWGMFTITVPKDFGSKKLTWTLTANGVTTSIPANLNPLWEVAPFRDASGNTPPFIGFSEKGPFGQGPRGLSTAMKASLGVPLPLQVWVADDANVTAGGERPLTPPVTLIWGEFRGPGNVKFSNNRPLVEMSEFPAPSDAAFRGKASTTATFSEPGEYVLRLGVNDWSGEGGKGFQCCWTNAQVRISVSASKQERR